MTQRVDKDSLPLNQPRRTPGHPDKSHIVKTKVDGKEKLIRFGEQGASTAGKPKEGESDRMKAKRASFKSRHAKNIAKGPSSPAYWANKVKWADGGSVRLNYAQGDSVRVTPQNAALGSIANFLKQSYAPQRTQQMQGVMEFLGVPAVARTVERMSYGQPITNLNKANVPLLPEDTAEAAMIVAPPLASMAKRVGTNLVQTAPYVARDIAQSMSSPLKSYVVKPKGGNWLSGSVESAIKPLKGTTEPRLTHINEQGQAVGPGYGRPMTQEELQTLMSNPMYERNKAVNRWLDTKLNKYIRNEMGTPEDPVRALAERGILHVDPERGLSYHPQDVVRNRMAADSMVRTPTLESPGTRMGVMPPAREWEDATDAMIVPRSAGDLTAGANKSPYWETSLTTEHRLEQDPWLAKVPPETPVYQFGDRADLRERLGLDHLVDELKFSMDPNSGLPDNLRFDPKDVDKITVPQAVERVSKINAWRAEQAAQAEKAGMMQNLQATPRLADEGLQLSFVDKPGGAWVDIPETTEIKGKQLCTSIGKAGGWCTQADWAATSYGSGENRLTALVDAEGRPHAQAKISTRIPDPDSMELGGMLNDEDALADQIYRNAGRILSERGFGDAEDLAMTLGAGAERELPQAARDILGDVFEQAERMVPKKELPIPDITELKPPGNSFTSDRAQEYMKRDPDYKAKVTDSVLKFLNGGEWGKVNDLDHYDIIDAQDPNAVLRALGKVSPERNIQRAIDNFNATVDANPNAPRFMTQEQLRDFLAPVEPPDTDVPGYAGGGLVKGAVKNIGEMVQKYLAKDSPEAAVTAAKEAPKEQKMLMGVYRGYAGEAPGETVYHAGAEFTRPNPGLFTNPERAAVEQFQRFTGAPRLHTLEAKPRRAGSDEDVYAIARRLGVYNPGVPASQYLEQGENAIFPESALIVEELRGMGLDSLRLKDGMGKQPSLVALDPAVVRPAPELFATPQKRVADYYAQKRAAQTGERPHVEMVLVDPFAGRTYGHSTMGSGKQEPMTTRAKKLKPEDVKSRTQLYAEGGSVSAYDPMQVDDVMNSINAPRGYAEGGSVTAYDSGRVDAILNQFM